MNKKIFSIILALAMSTGVCVSASAATEESVSAKVAIVPGDKITIKDDTVWEENGNTYELLEGDVLGVCCDTVNQNARSTSSKITAEHYGKRQTDGVNNRQRVVAETRATETVTKNGNTSSKYVNSYSVARYEWLWSVIVTSGKQWSSGNSYWSYAATDWMDYSSARDIQARTYWGTEA